MQDISVPLSQDVIQDFVSPAGVEVEINVGDVPPFRIEKSFKKQIVCQRIYLGDSQEIQYDR
jgi:hypothetical protein